MCGVAGGVWWKSSPEATHETLAAMAFPLRFRGPDAEGLLIERNQEAVVAFAHRRLSIIDLSEAGNQPMRSGSQRTLVVFNGEIYNYRALKAELMLAGRQFRTASDTEVLLEGYEHWGMAALLSRLDGMFAFALYDFTEQALYLARDRFGKKPLYLVRDAGRVLFSSDIRSFEAIDMSRRINLHALGYFFAELSTPRNDTIYEAVTRVPRAHFMRFDEAGVISHCYWQLLATTSCDLSRQDVLDETDRLLTRAVEKRMVADVNVAAQLSGGIDSSLIVAKMASLSSRPVATYSVGFDDALYNELPFARQVARRYQTEHHEMIMRPDDVSMLDEVIQACGEPFADVSVLPSYLISRFIAGGEKVVCGGDGGDELFSGYHSYYVANKLDQVQGWSWASPLADVAARLMPGYRTRFLSQLLRLAGQPRWALLNRNMGFSPGDLERLLPGISAATSALAREHMALWQATPVDEPLVKRVMLASLDTRLLNDYLVKVDRASMHASLEMRSPFLDKDLAAFAFSLPADLLMSPHGNKSVLKSLAERYLPHEVIYRDKKGFGVPIDNWFRGALRSRFEAVVLQQRQTLIDMDYDFVAGILRRHVAGEDHTHRLWAIYVWHVWAGGR